MTTNTTTIEYQGNIFDVIEEMTTPNGNRRALGHNEQMGYIVFTEGRIPASFGQCKESALAEYKNPKNY